jgi:hypothetical protein
MTAIKKYTRLEANGFWKESAKSDQIEVLITFGKTSIILLDYKDNPLTHWSLSAIKLVSRNQDEVIFSTDLENGESLIITDASMIDSFLLFITKDEKTPKGSKFLYYFIITSLMILTTLFVLFLPSKIRSSTESIISQAHESQLVEPFIDNHIKKYGSVCSSPQTKKILKSILTAMTNVPSNLTLKIVRYQKINALHLPGGTILVSNTFLKNSSNERNLVELIEQELLKASNRKPLEKLINEQNLFLLVKFILGFETDLPVKKISSFLVETGSFPVDKISQLDDFSWVALKNICLN